MKKLITLSFLAMLFGVKAMASHIAFAEIRYEYTGTGNDYNVILTLMRGCEPGAASLGTWPQYINATSSCSSLPNIPLSFSSVDTISSLCNPSLNSCNIIGSSYWGFERYTYQGVVTLPSCSDWVLSFSECCRNSAILNLAYAFGESIYVEAKLDNSAAINTNAWMSNPAPLVTSVGVPTQVPLQIVDAENDSIGVEWYTPLSVQSTPVAYGAGYSLTNPLGAGGIASLDLANGVITMQAPIAGKFVLGLKITEYRNGTVVGTSLRDFTVVAAASTSPFTVPMPVAGSNFNYTTCPGQSNSISLNFQDSTATDSVFLTVIPPTISGFSFSTSTTSGPGAANATISWTTPAGFNPATLPYFYIQVNAKDNNCPYNSLSSYMIAVQTAQCVVDSVWAGDANGDFTVNTYDPLAIAVAYGETGPARTGATTSWQAEYCAPWANSFINGVNMKHADCNGDGTVDNMDLPAVVTNWGQTHMRNNGAKTTSATNLHFDANGIQFIPGTTVSVPIMFGDAGYVVDGFYGLGTTISIGGITPANPATITYPSSWLGTAANTVRFAYTDAANTNMIDWAYSRNDHQNTNGNYGQLAMLNFDIPASTPLGTQIDLQFVNTHFIDKDMQEETTFSTLDTTVTTPALGVNSLSSGNIAVQVLPNPSSAEASLQMSLMKDASVTVLVTDAAGRIVFQQIVNGHRGTQKITLPQVASGIYMVKAVAEGNKPIAVKWIRN